MEEQTRALSQLTVERDNLIERISSMEQEHNETVAMWQQQVRMKEETLAAEISQLETSFKESEHMLKEEVEEKANIIQVRLPIYTGKLIQNYLNYRYLYFET